MLLTSEKTLQKLEGGIGVNPSQLVDVAFRISNNREEKKAQVATMFLEQASGQCHLRQEVPDPHLKRLPPINAQRERALDSKCPKRGKTGPEPENSRVLLKRGNHSDD